MSSQLDNYRESLLRSFGERVFNHVPECICNALDQMTILRTQSEKLRHSVLPTDSLRNLA